MFKNIFQIFNYFELIRALVTRQIKVRFSQTLFGYAWAILQPFSSMVIFTIVFSKFVRIPTEGIPYPIFVYSALVVWLFFSNSISAATESLVANTPLVLRIYFPREVFPISSIISIFVDFIIAFSLLGIMFIFYRITITLTIFYFIPIFVIQLILILGISLFLCALNVYYRDIRFVTSLVFQLWMFASPVIYPVSAVPDRFMKLYMLNPMACIINGYRNVLLRGIPPDFKYLLIAFGISILILCFSYWFFKRQEKTFADVI